jgi:hydrogenase maturation factor HypF (carbamoyltransferase family)
MTKDELRTLVEEAIHNAVVNAVDNDIDGRTYEIKPGIELKATLWSAKKKFIQIDITLDSDVCTISEGQCIQELMTDMDKEDENTMEFSSVISISDWIKQDITAIRGVK